MGCPGEQPVRSLIRTEPGVLSLAGRRLPELHPVSFLQGLDPGVKVFHPAVAPANGLPSASVQSKAALPRFWTSILFMGRTSLTAARYNRGQHESSHTGPAFQGPIRRAYS